MPATVDDGRIGRFCYCGETECLPVRHAGQQAELEPGVKPAISMSHSDSKIPTPSSGLHGACQIIRNEKDATHPS